MQVTISANPLTPEEVTEAAHQLCKLRGIPPQSWHPHQSVNTWTALDQAECDIREYERLLKAFEFVRPYVVKNL